MKPKIPKPEKMNGPRFSRFGFRPSSFLVCLGIWSFAFLSPVHAQDAPAAETAPELTEAADHAIERGLQYLITTQNANGSWTSKDGNFEVAGTSLGLMAFMVKGEFPGFGRNGAALDRAKDFLLKKVTPASISVEYTIKKSSLPSNAPCR